MGRNNREGWERILERIGSFFKEHCSRNGVSEKFQQTTLPITFSLTPGIVCFYIRTKDHSRFFLDFVISVDSKIAVLYMAICKSLSLQGLVHCVMTEYNHVNDKLSRISCL